jgi:hypothetical protein
MFRSVTAETDLGRCLPGYEQGIDHEPCDEDLTVFTRVFVATHSVSPPSSRYAGATGLQVLNYPNPHNDDREYAAKQHLAHRMML